MNRRRLTVYQFWDAYQVVIRQVDHDDWSCPAWRMVTLMHHVRHDFDVQMLRKCLGDFLDHHNRTPKTGVYRSFTGRLTRVQEGIKMADPHRANRQFERRRILTKAEIDVRRWEMIAIVRHAADASQSQAAGAETDGPEPNYS